MSSEAENLAWFPLLLHTHVGSVFQLFRTQLGACVGSICGNRNASESKIRVVISEGTFNSVEAFFTKLPPQ
jgi:hypothetical protein